MKDNKKDNKKKSGKLNTQEPEGLKNIEYLSKISSPEDLKAIPESELPKLAEEIRSELIRIVSNNGGHLASNLGVVELTMALHRVFSTPQDHIIFDVSHQSYVHKMLTGRYNDMETLRQAGGISGFTKREESEHDCFGTGHSSTSVSAALGFAVADKLRGSDAYTIAVVGDGAYTGGMIHEALNNCRKDLKLIIVLNENAMSISRNIGRFANTLAKLRTSSGYFKTKRFTGKFLRKIPLVGKPIFNGIKRFKMAVKNAFYGSNYFESMGLTYLGPIDGNDYEAVENLLTEAKKLGESVIVHIKTLKGKGYPPAEKFPDEFHSVSAAAAPTGVSFSNAFGSVLTELGKTDERICAITAAMSEGTGLEEWHKTFKKRFFDVGIAEEHALTFAAGLAAHGMKPCAAIYSTFLQRGYDNIIHDIALQKLPVVIAIDRAGLNAKDGATHHGIFDVAFLSQVPNMRIYTPVTNMGLEASLKEAFASNAPCAIRYPSGYEAQRVLDTFYADGGFENIGIKTSFADGDKLDAVIVTHGKIADEALIACEMLASEGKKVGIILLEVLKPYDVTAERVLRAIPENVSAVLFLEEEIRAGGMGMNLADKLRGSFAERNIAYDILALDDHFAEKLQKGQTIYELAGVDKHSICERIKNIK